MKNKYLFDLLPIAKEFYNFEKNTGIDANLLGVGSKKEVWWKCPKCGDEAKIPVCKKARKQKDGSYVFSTCKNCYRELVPKPSGETGKTRTKRQKISEVDALIRLWDKDNNPNLDPTKISSDSRFPINWKCPDCGFRWSGTARVLSARHGRCLQCSSNKVVVGVSDIFTLVPEAKEYYDFERNKDIDISTITVSSSKKVWWKCPDCGVETFTPVVYKIRKSDGAYTFKGCSDCSRKNPIYFKRDGTTKDSVADTPRLIRIWDKKRNTGMNPALLARQSNRVANWICPDCGYTWKKAIYRVALSNGKCPQCTSRDTISAGYNDVFSLVPEAEDFYDFKKNKSIDISTLGIASSTNVWWKCPNCGKELYSPIKNKIRKNRDGTYSFVPCSCSVNKKTRSTNAIQRVSDDVKLMRIWDRSKNTLDPNTTLANSTKRAGWKCPKCGYTWSSTIRDAARSTGLCPCCDLRRVVTAGVSDFLTLVPEAEKYYDYEKNKDVDASCLGISSMKRVWWKCPDCGYESYMPISSKIKKDSAGKYYVPKCKKCRGNGSRGNQLVSQPSASHEIKDSLAVLHPDVAKRWSSKNLKGPTDVRSTSSYNALWVCDNCGGEFDAPVRDMVSGAAICPYCNDLKVLSGFNSLDVTHPMIARMWSASNERSVDSVGANYTIDAVWKCPECNGEYTAQINDVVEGRFTCPYCNDRRVLPGFNSLAVRYPQLLTEWDYIKNYVSGLNPDELLPRARDLVWWRCPNGHSYRMSPKKRSLFEKRRQIPCRVCKGFRLEKQHFI